MEVLPGVDELIPRYPGGAASLTAWATGPNHELGGLTPAEILGKREPDVVIALAVSMQPTGS
jgi:hypothetical protein